MVAEFAGARRWLTALVVLLMAVVGPLSALPAYAAGPTPWNATVGYQSSDKAVQANFFFPNNLTIDVGDSISWTLKSGEFHTISFLSGGARPPLIANGTFNPAVLFPVVNSTDTYDGTGYVNSGAMGALPIKTFTLKFTAPGTFEYNCLVHTPMKGWVTVQPAGTAYPHSQTFYDAQAGAAEVAAVGQGYALEALGLAQALSAGVGHVTAGIGRFFSAGSLAIVRFLPQVTFTHVGQTVIWDNRDPEFPHTITFNLPALDGDPFAAFQPSANAVGGSATISSTSDGVNSGVLAAGMQTQFKVTFTAPGTYAYRCVLHDDLGMDGTVVVLPGS